VGGRAGVIVPEGIIFQSSNAYKALRKMLVEENYLVAVISLPAGVFNPYSGVKTSVLLLDKTLARRSESVLFVKVAADGYGLGAQRREIEPNDLPEALRLVKAFQADPAAALPKGGLAQKVSKRRLAEGGDYNLSAERYRANGVVRSKWPMVRLGEILSLEYGKPLKEANRRGGEYPVYGSNGIVGWHSDFLVEGPFIIVGRKGSAGEVTFSEKSGYPIDTTFFVKLLDNQKTELKFIYRLLKYVNLGSVNTQSGVPGLNRNDAYQIEVPLPPLEIQRDIVEEIEGYQKVIDGARQVVENYKPVIPIDPSWPMVKLGELCEIKGGKRIPKGMTFSNRITDHPYIRVTDFQNHGIERKGLKFIDDTVFKHISRYTISKNDVYLSIAGTIGLVGIIPKDLEGSNLTENAAKLVIKYPTHLNNRYLVFCIASDYVQKQINVLTHAVGVPKLALERIKLLEIPLAPIEFQNKLVTEMNQEDDLVQKCHEIISQFEEKITVLIERIWETS
ncbi:MAG: restriction endonuclease subunit S, partial [Veillonellales bacterium]